MCIMTTVQEVCLCDVYMDIISKTLYISCFNQVFCTVVNQCNRDVGVVKLVAVNIPEDIKQTVQLVISK